jgi:hypothetical protein
MVEYSVAVLVGTLEVDTSCCCCCSVNEVTEGSNNDCSHNSGSDALPIPDCTCWKRGHLTVLTDVLDIPLEFLLPG